MNDLLVEEDAPDLQAVLDALDDPDCRAIVQEATDPMTARELAAATEIPLSTLYRKLELLTDAGLLDDGVEIHDDGTHSTRYARLFKTVEITLTDQREFEVSIERFDHLPADQLHRLWSEVQKET